MIIAGKINLHNRNFYGIVGAVEQTQTLPHTTGLCVANALVNSDAENIPVRIANFGNMIKLDKGQVIALLHPVDLPSINMNENAPHTGSCHAIDEVDSVEVPDHLKALVDGVPEECTESEREQVAKLVCKYQKSFMGPDGKLGRTPLVKHTIDTGTALPVKQRLRVPPVQMQDAVDAEIDKLLKQKVIEPSTSPWSSPLIAVTKKDGSIRLCTDLRKVNSLMVNKNAYPLPKIEQCLDTLSGSQFFSCLDLAQGYHQVPMDEKDKEKTAFSTRKGHFQHTVMPFGLANSPSSFEQLMEITLRGLQWEVACLYLDDVICFGKTFQEALQSLEKVVIRFQEANLMLKPSKCKLMQTSVEFLGHIVSREGIATDPKKIEAVRDWPRPKTVKEVRSFVGFAQYYRRYIKLFF
jgi:hypothetical protein